MAHWIVNAAILAPMGVDTFELKKHILESELHCDRVESRPYQICKLYSTFVSKCDCSHSEHLPKRPRAFDLHVLWDLPPAEQKS